VLVSWEAQREGIGYLLDRAGHLGLPLNAALSRTPAGAVDRRHGADSYGEAHDSGIWVAGRVVLNAWRLMRGELKLGIYSLEAVAHSVLRVRLPHYSYQTLTGWWTGARAAQAQEQAAAGAGAGASAGTWMTHVINNPPLPSAAGASSAATGGAPFSRSRAAAAPSPRLTRWRVLDYTLTRAAVTLHLLHSLDVLGRSAEMARLIGIDLYSVLSRGSQYRVEAVMVRVAHPFDYLLPSPSPGQVARQAAMEVQPLILEPRSRVYACPVVVLDYQSLYPSIVIAYNMCYSTLLGRLAPGRDGMRPSGIGFMAGWAPPPGAVADAYTGPWEGSAVRRLEPPPHATVRGSASARPHRPRSAYIAPNGVVFAPWTARRGVLPRMLSDILDTRVMVKGAMKRGEVAADPALTRTMNARQHALKMIANTTYGYTAAGFSGRMPCAEIADAIVQTARTTLERTIRLVEGHPGWRAQVVYGDTDSLFVALPGRSVADAFRVGAEIAAEATARNPRPMVLKLEKVYFPCVLVAKKRYAGFSYESPGQAAPTLDCKGLEMVRRDTCGLVSKAMEATLRTLFSPSEGHGRVPPLGVGATVPPAPPAPAAGARQGDSKGGGKGDGKGDGNGGGKGGGRAGAPPLSASASALTAAGAASGSRADVSRLDLSRVRALLVGLWEAMLSGRAPPQDYIFAKEVRMGTYSDKGPPPPAAVVASKAQMADARAEPRYGERVRYVVRYGEPQARLVDLVVAPHTWLRSAFGDAAGAPAAAAGAGVGAGAGAGVGMRINSTYYITKQIIPALERILSLVGADVRVWFTEMRRPTLQRPRLELVPPLRWGPPRPGGGAGGDGRGGYLGASGQLQWISAASQAEFAAEGSRRYTRQDMLAGGAHAASGGGDGGGVGASRPGIRSRADFAASAGIATGLEAALHNTAGGHGDGGAVNFGPWLGGAASASGDGRSGLAGGRGSTLDSYYASCACEVCGAVARSVVCDACASDRQRLYLVIGMRARRAEAALQQVNALCCGCTGLRDAGPSGAGACDSLDCPVFFERARLGQEARHSAAVAAALEELP
jgi:DNA polymerase elongation subunit (family B)